MDSLGLRILSAALVAVLLGGVTTLSAQEKPADFPQRPINLTVMYPAGGAVDVTARTFAEVAGQMLGHDFRVENRLGGAGIVGHTYLAKTARPDGYAVGVIANPFMFTDILLRGAEFTIDEFEPLTTISFDPVIWLINGKSELGDQSFEEIIATAKERTLQVGMNPDSMFLFVSEFIEQAQDVEFNFIPFDGGRQGVIALLAGDIDATAAFYTEVEQYTETGDLKAVAVTGDKRHSRLPNTPTFNELGVPAGGQTWGATRFFTVHPDTPNDRKAYLEAAFLSVLESDELAAAFDEAGLTLTPAGTEETQQRYRQTYEDLQSFLRSTGRLK